MTPEHSSPAADAGGATAAGASPPVVDARSRLSRRPVVGHASPLHGVGVLSLPALGAVGRRRRAVETAVGLVQVNRPWRLAVRLSRTLTAAIAAGAFTPATPDIWRLVDAFGAWRLALVAVGSVVAIAGTLVVGAQLWERPGTGGCASRSRCSTPPPW
ncbi:hypothetical protein [Blastococcus sp. SYSU DS0533]